MRLPRKLKKQAKKRQRIVEALQLVALMTAISIYKAVNHFKEFNLPNHE